MNQCTTVSNIDRNIILEAIYHKRDRLVSIIRYLINIIDQ
jgi:hypothetical protein